MPKRNLEEAASKIVRKKGEEDRPSSLSELLDGKGENGSTETRTNGDTDIRVPVSTGMQKLVRQEFLFPSDLVEDLRTFVFENRSPNKTAVVIEAVRKHIKRKSKGG